MKYFLPILIIGTYNLLQAQTIMNVTSIQQGNNAIVSYDLNGTAGSTYFVKLYYSTDGGQNFSAELTQVSGDVKGGMKSGIGKKIFWDAFKEVNYLNGPVIFKVEGEVRKAMPKPVAANGITIEVTGAKRNGEEIMIEFLLTQNTDDEKRTTMLAKENEITSLDGKQYLSTSMRLGTAKDYFQGVDCIKGVPVKGQLTFQAENNDLLIPALKIQLPYGKVIVIKNIPVE